ncbi:uncharacterized protein [Dysidea avara]|uniref:uncharacterized protein isoform X2 n=1 Tax=Dysidea avara TaxID=196820 RepID=UPI0033328262
MTESMFPRSGTGRKPTREENSQVIDAAKYGKLQVLLDLSSRGVDVTAARDVWDDSPLHKAARNGHYNLVAMMLKAGVPVNLKSKDGGTPLHHACSNGHINCAKLLCDHKAEIDMKDIYGDTQLTWAVTQGQSDAVKFLVHQAKADCSKVPQKWQESLTELLNRKEGAANNENLSHEQQQDRLKQLYHQTKHNFGSQKLQLLKLLIFGPPGAGKSSLLQVLLGGDPDPERNSTGLCDRKLVQCRIAVFSDGSKSVWSKINLNNEIQKLRSKIEEKLYVKSVSSHSIHHVDNIDPVHSDVHLKIEEGILETIGKPTEDSGPSSDTMLDFRISDGLIACYDCGGQPEFFDVMPALITAPTGYVMVFDMSKSMNSQNVEFYKKGKRHHMENAMHYTDAELLKTALSNIMQSCDKFGYDEKLASKLSRVGRLLIVGTHLDKCGATKEDKDEKVWQIETMMEEDILKGFTVLTPEVVQRHDGTIIYPISNVVIKGNDEECSEKQHRSEISQEIRTAIETMSMKEKISTEIPTSWLLFQLEIRCNEKYYIERSRCVRIAKKCFIKEDDVDTVLMYFHELGVLLHYRNIASLKHIVFCDPQWLFDKLTKLIEVKYNPPREMRQKISEGIFDKAFLCKIYCNDFVSNDVLNYEHLLRLFVSLNIMAILPDETFSNKTDQYFMPALLNPVPKELDVSLQKCYGAKIYSTLIVKFENGYYPRGVFCCLVVQCMKLGNGWQIKHKTIYKNLIIFQISSGHYVFLIDQIDAIAIEIHGNEDKPLVTSPDIVYDTVYTALQRVCIILEINNDLKVGFICKSILIDGTCCDGFTCIKNQLPFRVTSVCENCNEKQQLEDDQLVWLISFKFLKEKWRRIP